MFRSKRSIAILFLVAALALLVQAAPALAAGMNVTPASGTAGTTFTLVADGFNAGEAVSISVTAPNNSSVASGTVNADAHGHLEFSAQIPSGSPTGRYSVTAQGQSSHRQFSAGFTVTGSSSAGTSTGSVTPAKAGMTITPSSGDYTTSFVVTVGGFNPGEPVSVWVVAPGNSTFGPQTLTADASGAIQVSGQVPSGDPAGKYTAYAQGQYSGHQYSSTFSVTAPAAGSFPDWKGEYFNNQNLSGSPVLTRNDTAINFDWGLGSPDPSVPSDHFSVRWTRNLFLNAGTYTFTATTDDGMRVWVNNTLLIDAWYDQSATTYTANITLASGTYPVRVEYYDDTQAAIAQVTWATASTSTTEQPWTGSYYNNMTLSGTPVVVRQDATLNFDWGGSSPVSGVGGTNWSAKWDSTQYAPTSGNYTIFVTADDGVRVWIDGNLVIDQWHDQPPTEYSATFYANAGAHNVHVEYYQNQGGSSLVLGFVQD